MKNLSEKFWIYGVRRDKLAQILNHVIEDLPKGFSISFDHQFPKIAIEISGSGGGERLETAFKEVVEDVKRELETYVLIPEDKSLAEILLSEMHKRKLTLAAGESCTGGLIGKMITDVPGSSQVFLGSLATYSSPSKITLLGVSEEDIDAHTAVSKPVAEAMVKGARDKFGADYAVSTTGFAGPSGGTEENPVGTVYIGLASEDKVWVKRFNLPGNRGQVRFLAAACALELLRRLLEKRSLNLEF